MTQVPNQFRQSVVKGQLDLRMNPNTIPCQIDSGEAGTLIPGQAVKIVDNAGGVPKVEAIAADTDKIFGVIAYNIKNASFVAGDAVEISADGNVIYMEASAAIARGAKLMAVVTGSKVATVTGGKIVLGFAFDKAAADGDLIRVYMENFSEQANAGTATNVADILPTTPLTALVPAASSLTASAAAISTADTYTDAAVNAGIDAAVDLVIAELDTALDLKADNADVETLRTETEARLDAIEAQNLEVIDALIAAGLMSA